MLTESQGDDQMKVTMGSGAVSRGMLVAGVLAVAACGGGAPPVPPTLVTVVASASEDANAAAGGGTGAPVSLRVYQLASPAGFEAAPFFPLFNGDATVLKDDLVRRDDLLLAPGQSKALPLAPADRVTAVGVFAAYRDYENVAWRAVVAVPAHVRSRLVVMAGKAGVTARIEPQP